MSLTILDTRVDPNSYLQAVDQILLWAQGRESRSVYAANVHMLMEAHDHADFRQMVNAADLVTPDGMPLVWALRLKGFKQQQRVYGPTLMLEVLREAEQQQIHVGFLGSTDAILEKLSGKLLKSFPELKIAVQMPLPFRPLMPAEDAAICDKVNFSGSRILFVALGCPKQERWIAEHRGKINAVMIGVGAAFAFHAGVVRQAPPWMQQLGMEWLFRLTQEPRRLWKRYLMNNPRFVFLVLVEFLKERFLKNKEMGERNSC